MQLPPRILDCHDDKQVDRENFHSIQQPTVEQFDPRFASREVVPFASLNKNQLRVDVVIRQNPQRGAVHIGVLTGA